jgi:murein DD-endopeptidase MepM/ murein hydrolase activator NlpD
VQLQKMSFSNQIELAKFDASTKLWLLRASKELDMMFPEYQYKEVEIDWVKTTVAVNPYDPTDYKAINTNLSKDYFSNIWSGKVTSRWGQHDWFQGVDIDGKIWDPVPTLWGKVVKVVTWQGKSSTPSYWNYVDIQDENWYIHRYAHLNDVNVEEGQTIPKWFTLWTIGNSWYTISGAWGDW